MIRADESLSKLCHLRDHVRTIKHIPLGAELKVVAADADVVGGSKASFIFVDELWLFGKKRKSASVLSEALGGLVARPEGFAIFASTHSDEAPAGVMKSKLKQYRDIRDGKKQDNTKLGLLYEFPKKLIKSKAYLKPENFYITNPNLNRSVSEVWLKQKLQENIEGDSRDLQVFLANHLNVEIDIHLSSDRWAGADIWKDGATPGLTLQDVLDRSEVAVVGIDGGGKDDLFGLTVAGRERGTNKYLCWSHGFALRSALDVRKEIAQTLLDFVREGTLTLTDTLGEMLQAVCDIIAEVEASDLLPAEYGIGMDSAQIGALVDALDDMGIGQPCVTGMNTQSWGMCSAIYTAEFKLHDGQLLHDGSSLMNWCVGNAKTIPLKNTVLITKQASGVCKIDPLISFLLAMKLLEANPSAVSPKRQLKVFSMRKKTNDQPASLQHTAN